jgi:hypothetical protein
MAYQLRAARYRPSGHRGRPQPSGSNQYASCGCLQINGDVRASNGAVRRLNPRQVEQAWISARVGGDQTGPTRAPNRRLPAARADNPLRAPTQQF